MPFKCIDCNNIIRKVEDVRNCERCQSNGRASSIPSHHDDSNWLTPAILGYMIGSSFSSPSHEAPVSEPEPFSGGGGLSGGAGASGSWDDSSSGSSSSSDSRSDSGSSSSDSGSSSSDSGGSSSGGDS